MITKLEIDGFKTFQNFKIEFAPFQVIVGPNASGKSNLFDALKLLSKLADTDLRSAFQNLRGDAGELFTTFPSGKSTNKMSFVVEMFVNKNIKDSWGAEEKLKNTRLRYELHIERKKDEKDLERLYVTFESLTVIRRKQDKWYNKFVGYNNAHWRTKMKTGRTQAYISTKKESEMITISLHADGHGGMKKSVAEKIERTVLSGVLNTEFAHAFSVREEMKSWKFLQLNPERLREPSSMLANPTIEQDGSNLPAALARMELEDKSILKDIRRDLVNLIPGIQDLSIEKDERQNRYIIRAKMEDNRDFTSRVLSDGTLRVLALVALKHDIQNNSVVCFEEPENGVHPFRLKNMLKLLKEMATDFKDEDSSYEPLKQLIINTHSPILVGFLINEATSKERKSERLDYLLYAQIVNRINSDNQKIRITKFIPISPKSQLTLEFTPEELAYNYSQVMEYLNTIDLGESMNVLKEEFVR